MGHAHHTARLSQIRRELRERLMQERVEGVEDVLAVLRKMAEERSDLVNEHARWAFRFELLSVN